MANGRHTCGGYAEHLEMNLMLQGPQAGLSSQRRLWDVGSNAEFSG